MIILLTPTPETHRTRLQRADATTASVSAFDATGAQLGREDTRSGTQGPRIDEEASCVDVRDLSESRERENGAV